MSRYRWSASAAALSTLAIAACSDDTTEPPPPDPMRVDTLLTGLTYPSALWVRDGSVYLTENGRGTVFGGNVRLIKYDVLTDQMQVLVDQPVNPRAVVATSSTRLYLANYVGGSVGGTGKVSRVDFANNQWTESPLIDVGISASDLFLDPGGDVYLIGLSDSPTAPSLYRLSAPGYTNAAVIATGLGRSAAVTRIGSDIYYGKVGVGTREIRRIRNGIDEPVLPGVGAFSLTSDGEYLYYADYDAGTVARRHLTTGSIDTLIEDLASPRNVRFDASARKLYVVTSGTNAAQFKDGLLLAISSLPP